MSLQFVFGNSGSGKSSYLYETILEQAAEQPDKNFLVLVPEQFTMQTQRELVERQSRHAIMNVDVLSFARLAYRVFDELGKQDLVVLEETGKNLVLRKVAEQKKAELKVLGGNMNKMGYISEVKSLISELTQYNITPELLEEFLGQAGIGEALRLKMQDVLTMYRGFAEYMEGKFITAEEVLALLCDVAEESELLRDSVIVFDEFTGFTPIQNRLMRKLMQISDKIMVSVTIDTREDFYHSRGIHELFAMSKKTVGTLQKMASELHIPVEEPVILPTGEKRRYKGAPDLFFMEQNLFRYRKASEKTGAAAEKKSEQNETAEQENPEHIHITGLKNPREELKFAARQITLLVREQGYCYKDMAVVTGDVAQYANYVPEIFEKYDIPYFIDQTKNILFHPFIECIRAMLEIVEQDFSYESVFRFLRCGLAENLLKCGERRQKKNASQEEIECAVEENNTAEETNIQEQKPECPVEENNTAGETNQKDAQNSKEDEKAGAETNGDSKQQNLLTEEDIDTLENYVLAKGIRGNSKWKHDWTFVMNSETLLDMARLNEVREELYQSFLPLLEVFRGQKADVRTQTYALYCLIRDLGLEALLKRKEEELAGKKEVQAMTRAKEYAQIYKIVMDLLDKVTALLGEETISIREYSDILDAGFEAAKVGVIPPGNDKVIIGDIERTRLNHIKILFFVGVNDGVVPKSGSQGGIISQLEREKMTECRLELAPGAREKVFIQKFYLYLNMTKPSHRLYVTFAKVNSDGKALRRSYLIGTLLNLFPGLTVEEPPEMEHADEILTPESALQFFIEGLQNGGFPETKEKNEGLQNGDSPETEQGEEETEKGTKEAEQRKLRESWQALASWYLSDETYRERAQKLFQAAFEKHSDSPISRAVTKALYGNTLENSVTRLERFAACAFSHYLTYGLLLRERELQQFASVDMGNIYHDVLEHFAKRVEESEYTWFDAPKEQQEIWMEESMEDAIAGYRAAEVFSDARNRYLLERMKTTVRRTVWALITQIRKGKFTPSGFEVSFSRASDLDAITFTLGEEEKMRLQGRIDRIDTYETEDKVYVKIIDYKSGNTSFSLLNLYHGLQLQLVVYLNAAMELVKKEHPEKTAEPAGIFYYHISDPMVEGSGTESEEEIKNAILEQLKLNGLVNDNPEVYGAMDTEFSGNSSVIPVGLKTDGSLKATSKVASAFEFGVMSDYAKNQMIQAGKQIFAGEASVRPYQLEDKTGCDYCPYHTVCGFDVRLPGYEYRKLEKFDSAEEILEKMKGTE